MINSSSLSGCIKNTSGQILSRLYPCKSTVICQELLLENRMCSAMSVVIALMRSVTPGRECVGVSRYVKLEET